MSHDSIVYERLVFLYISLPDPNLLHVNSFSSGKFFNRNSFQYILFHLSHLRTKCNNCAVHIKLIRNLYCPNHSALLLALCCLCAVCVLSLLKIEHSTFGLVFYFVNSTGSSCVQIQCYMQSHTLTTSFNFLH